MINYICKFKKVVNKLNKKAQKIMTWTMLIIMLSSVIAGILVYIL